MERYSAIIVENIDDRKEEIHELWKDVILVSNENRFDWLYKENPVGQSFACIVIDNKSGATIGCGSVYRRDIFISGELVKMGIAIDFGVDEKHRVIGPALSIQRKLIEEAGKRDLDIIFAYPNKLASGVFVRAGYKRLGASNDFFRTLKFSEKIKVKISNPLMVGPGALLLDNLNRLYDAAYRLLFFNAHYAVILERADERFDRVFESSRRGYEIVEDRSSEFLNWRYLGGKGDKCRFYCLFDKKDGALLGYLNYSIHAGNNEAIVKDIFPTVDHGHVRELLLRFSQEMRSQGLKFITVCYFGNEDLEKLFKKLLFRKSNYTREYVMYISPRLMEKSGHVLTDKNNYRFFYG